MENLEERLLKLEAESAVQNALIRALIEMLPPPHPVHDQPLMVAIRSINASSGQMEEPARSAHQAALQAMDPLKMSRRKA